MASRLLDSKTVYFPSEQLYKYVNDANKTNFQSLVQAINGLGISVVGVAIKNEIAVVIAGLLSVGLALADIIEDVEDALDPRSLQNTIDRMIDGDSLAVRTNYYEWSSGSGNSYTYYADTSYDIIDIISHA